MDESTGVLCNTKGEFPSPDPLLKKLLVGDEFWIFYKLKLTKGRLKKKGKYGNFEKKRGGGYPNPTSFVI